MVQQDTALSEEQYDISGSSDVMRLAVNKIETRKQKKSNDRQNRLNEYEEARKKDAEKIEVDYQQAMREYPDALAQFEQLKQKWFLDVEEFGKNPVTFAQFAMGYVLEHQEEIIQRVMNEYAGSGVNKTTIQPVLAFVMNKIIFPAIGKKVVLTGANKWKPVFYEKDATGYGMFLRNALGPLISDYRRLYLNSHWCAEWGDILGKLISDQEEVSLADLLDKLAFGMNQSFKSCNGMRHSGNDKCNMSGVFNDLEIDRYPEAVMANAGFYIFEAIGKLSYKKDWEVTLNRNDLETGLLYQIKRILSGLPYPKKPVEPKKPELPVKSFVEDVDGDNPVVEIGLPSLEKLDAVKSQLQILMIRLGINRKYYEVLPGDGKAGKEANGKDKSVAQPAERKFFDEMARTVFGDDKGGSSVFDALKGYGETSSLGLWSETKGSLRKKYNSEPIAQEVTELYQMAQFLYNIQTVGKIYMECGEPRQKYYGEILMEVGKIYTERLVEMAVNLEVKLRVGDFKTGEIGKTMSGLAGLLDSSQLSSAIEAAIQVETGLKAGEEANSVLTNKGQLASFDQRLAEGNGNK